LPSQAHPRRVAVGEFYALRLERRSYIGKGAGVGGASASLEIGQGLFRDARAFSELFLRPVQQGAPGATLLGAEGASIFFYNVILLY
jgi:hypothetical protein